MSRNLAKTVVEKRTNVCRQLASLLRMDVDQVSLSSARL